MYWKKLKDGTKTRKTSKFRAILSFDILWEQKQNQRKYVLKRTFRGVNFATCVDDRIRGLTSVENWDDEILEMIREYDESLHEEIVDLGRDLRGFITKSEEYLNIKVKLKTLEDRGEFHFDDMIGLPVLLLREANKGVHEFMIVRITGVTYVQCAAEYEPYKKRLRIEDTPWFIKDHPELATG